MEEPTNPKDRQSGKGCWYYTEIDECPLCGATTWWWRERRWTEKPETPAERYKYTQNTACPDHFL